MERAYRVRGESERRIHPLMAELVEQQAAVPGLFADQPQPMVLYDRDGYIVIGNVAAVQLLGHPTGTLVGTHYSAHLAPRYVAAAQRIWRRAAAGERCDFEAEFVHADGHPVAVSTTILPARLGPAIVGVYGIVRKVQRDREVAAAVEQADRFRSLSFLAAASGRTSKAQIDATLELGNDVLAVDCGAIVQLADGGAATTHEVAAAQRTAPRVPALHEAQWRRIFRRFDYVAVDDVGRPPWDREPACALLPFRSFIASPFAIGGRFAGVAIFGSVERRGELFTTSDGEFVRSIGAIVASTIERQLQQERLDALAFSDTLTGLPNRALLGDRLQQLIAEGRRNGESFALHFLDLDGFKHVNDTSGHAEGDNVLRQAAQRLKEALRESDSIARLGGDEFIVLQKHVRGPSEALALARTLLELMRLPFTSENGAHALSASIGISMFPGDGDSATQLIRNADIALYRAKSSGRNRAALFAPPAQGVAAEPQMQESVRE